MDNKVYKVIIFALFSYMVFMLVFFGLFNKTKKPNDFTLIVGNSTVWKHNKKEWDNIDRLDLEESLNWDKYKIYLNNKYLGEYKLWYNDKKWYAFDDNKKAIKTEGKLLAYKSNKDINVKDFSVIENTNLNNKYIKKVFYDNKIKEKNGLTVNNILNVDIDNDNIEETFYILSNAFSMDYTPNQVFSIVFMVKDDKIFPIYKNINENDYRKSCKPYINSIIDINNDNNYEIIVSCGKYSVEKPLDMLYQLKKDKFELIIYNE